MKEWKPGRTLVAVLVTAAVIRLGYDLLSSRGLQQTSALYVGLPLLAALLLAQLAPSGNCLRQAVWGTTGALLLGVILLQEAWFCVAMAAPVMIGVAAVVGGVAEHVRRRRTSARLLFLPLAVLALEGTHPALQWNSAGHATATRHIEVSAASVAAAIGQPARFDRLLPAGLAIGFPRPVHGSVTELTPGGQYSIAFDSGDRLVFEVTDVTANSATFRPLSQTGPMAEWIGFGESTVRWADDGAGTRVTWSVAYERHLDPAFYFGPLEQAAVSMAADYLITSVAVP